MENDLATRYWGSFFITATLCFILQVCSSKSAQKSANGATAASSARFTTFQLSYLVVYLLAMFSDWLQGPYVYELYVSYGFSQQQIAELFVCGFGSSMIVGTFAGGLADTLGRKNLSIVYAVLYIIACCTKLVPDYWTLMLGRLLSGVCTSLLFSVFESWMVCEHFKLGFDSTSLGETFAYATFGNGLVAVTAGLVANGAAESYGYVAPFVVAILPLTCVGTIVAFQWNENYGNQQLNLLSSLKKGFDFIRNDSRIAALGLAQSCFEGAMYTFVFMWTPALKSAEEVAVEASGQKNSSIETTSQYLGLIFAVFMVCTMVGSSFFKLFSARKENIYKIPLVVHSFAFVAMGLVTLFLEDKLLVYSMFLVFEMTVGLFYPAYGMIKSEKIPEDIRSGVMNIFRIPLNAFVVLLLLKIKQLSSSGVFLTCTFTHGLALLCYAYFYFHTRNNEQIRREEGEVAMELIAKGDTV